MQKECVEHGNQRDACTFAYLDGSGINKAHNQELMDGRPVSRGEAWEEKRTRFLQREAILP